MSRTGRIIVVPWQWFEEEREREYQQMIRDVESGKTSSKRCVRKTHCISGIGSYPAPDPPIPKARRRGRTGPISAHNVACYTAL